MKFMGGEKSQAMNRLNQEMRADKRLKCFNSNLVLGVGSLNSSLFFIGEAPGKKEDEQRLPFVGFSGKILDNSLNSLGLKREAVYITNLIKRRPPSNRNPQNKELKLFTPYLLQEIAIVRPKIIIPLGKFAFNFFFKDKLISEYQGQEIVYKGQLFFPIYHPAATLRRREIKKDYDKSFKKLARLLKSNIFVNNF